ncbi:MAG TPA: RsiV family protein [Reyranella sp.]|nr:RsiV family protein [Reyranella sp.]
MFGSGTDWLKTLLPLVRGELKKQFTPDRTGLDEAIEPDKLRQLLGASGLYFYRAGSLQLVFNPYVVGPYSSGTFKVNVPYDTLRPLFAPNGPLGGL